MQSSFRPTHYHTRHFLARQLCQDLFKYLTMLTHAHPSSSLPTSCTNLVNKSTWLVIDLPETLTNLRAEREGFLSMGLRLPPQSLDLTIAGNVLAACKT
jgi:hypothetical protein